MSCNGHWELRQATPTELRSVTALGLQLWHHHAVEELAQEFDALLHDPEAAVFLLAANGQDVGFAQCQLRHDYVEGTSGSPVGYLEGIYIDPAHRRGGGAQALLRKCEDWARTQGCREFASDCELENTQSLRFHLAMGFTEANRIICFTKKL